MAEVRTSSRLQKKDTSSMLDNQLLIYFPQDGTYLCLNSKKSKRHIKEGKKINDNIELIHAGKPWSGVIKFIGSEKECKIQELKLENEIRRDCDESTIHSSQYSASPPGSPVYAPPNPYKKLRRVSSFDDSDDDYELDIETAPVSSSTNQNSSSSPLNIPPLPDFSNRSLNTMEKRYNSVSQCNSPADTLAKRNVSASNFISNAATISTVDAHVSRFTSPTPRISRSDPFALQSISTLPTNSRSDVNGPNDPSDPLLDVLQQLLATNKEVLSELKKLNSIPRRNDEETDTSVENVNPDEFVLDGVNYLEKVPKERKITKYARTLAGALWDGETLRTGIIEPGKPSKRRLLEGEKLALLKRLLKHQYGSKFTPTAWGACRESINQKIRDMKKNDDF